MGERPVYTLLGEVLRQYRIDQRLMPHEMANRLGVRPIFLAQIEDGIVTAAAIGPALAVRIMTVTGIDAIDLGLDVPREQDAPGGPTSGAGAGDAGGGSSPAAAGAFASNPGAPFAVKLGRGMDGKWLVSVAIGGATRSLTLRETGELIAELAKHQTLALA